MLYISAVIHLAGPKTFSMTGDDISRRRLKGVLLGYIAGMNSTVSETIIQEELKRSTCLTETLTGMYVCMYVLFPSCERNN